jgi:hypothetical protein
MRYRSDQRACIVADSAPVKLISRDSNQSEFTQITYPGGENAGGLTKVGGIGLSDAFGLAKIS